MITWHKVKEDIREIIREDSDTSNVDLEDRDSWDDYAHEFADGAEWVIYYSRSRELWADSSDVQAYEDEANECGPFDSIDQWITVTVYMAVRAEIMEALQEIADERGIVAA